MSCLQYFFGYVIFGGKSVFIQQTFITRYGRLWAGEKKMNMEVLASKKSAVQKEKTDINTNAERKQNKLLRS